jgi:hypothetical protein
MKVHGGLSKEEKLKPRLKAWEETCQVKRCRVIKGSFLSKTPEAKELTEAGYMEVARDEGGQMCSAAAHRML